MANPAKLQVVDVLLPPPYNTTGIGAFTNPAAQEIWFMRNNKVRCPRCKKATRMSMRHCQHCSGEIQMSAPLMEAVLRRMLHNDIK